MLERSPTETTQVHELRSELQGLRRRQRRLVIALVAVVGLAAPAWMLARTATLPHTFSNASVADANHVNANFAELRDVVNENAAQWHVPSAAADPASPSTGRLYWNTETLSLRFFEGNNWMTLARRPLTATGGVISTFGKWTVHTFTGNGTFTPSHEGTVEVLLVGGGGAGGSSLTGGGGGGAVLHIASRIVTAQGYPIVIGAGGVGVAATNVAGGNGGSTTGFGETATGGAGAVGRYTAAAPVGLANGGGGASDAVMNYGIGVAPTASPGVTVYAGSNGGRGGGTTPNYPGGGGGGAGGDGLTPPSGSAAGGNGGPGVLINIDGTSSYWGGGGGGSAYTGGAGGGTGGRGGGGGGSANTGPGGAGGGMARNAGGAGLSGGGNSTAANAGGNGGANTGGGGGAGNHEPGRGGHGGTGIVIVRYARE